MKNNEAAKALILKLRWALEYNNYKDVNVGAVGKKVEGYYNVTTILEYYVTDVESGTSYSVDSFAWKFGVDGNLVAQIEKLCDEIYRKQQSTARIGGILFEK